jgi:hypothetical protein
MGMYELIHTIVAEWNAKGIDVRKGRPNQLQVSTGQERCYNYRMVFQGHIENGVVIPDGEFPLPNGTQVTIMVREPIAAAKEAMSEADRQRYLVALAQIDAVANENPGDEASGAEHDRYLYSEPS